LEFEHKAFDGAMKQARLAVAAHLDALAVVQDAKSLRLDHLRAELAKRLPASSELRTLMILRLPPEDEARLLLDLTTSVVMGGDGRTYRLEEDGPHGRRVLFESSSADAVVDEVLRRVAVARVEDAAKRGESRDSDAKGDSWAQSAFVFLAGMIFGASALAAIAIYLKKLVL
jgi:hypothetical protein